LGAQVQVKKLEHFCDLKWELKALKYNVIKFCQHVQASLFKF